MQAKPVIVPAKLRTLPKQFSWIDHRLVRDRYIEQCSHSALALYLFLVTVGDNQGLSYYSDSTLMGRLSMNANNLHRSRQELIQANLIAYQTPFYQVLALDCYQRRSSAPRSSASCAGYPRALSDILKQLGKNHD